MFLKGVRIIRVVIIPFVIFLLYRVFITYNWSVLMTMPFYSLGILFLFGVFVYLLWFLFYKQLLNALGFDPKFKDVVIVCCFSGIAAFGGYILASVSQIVLSKKILVIDYEDSISFSMLGTIIKHSLLLCFAICGLFFLVEVPARIAIGMILILFILLFLALLVNQKFIQTSRNRFFLYVSKIRKSLFEAKKSKVILACLVLFFIYLLYASMLVIMLKCFNCQCNLFVILCIRSMAALAGTISLIPMGLGSRDLGILSLLMLIGIDKDIAISSIIIDRIYSTALPLILSIIIGNIFLHKYTTDRKPAE